MSRFTQKVAHANQCALNVINPFKGSGWITMMYNLVVAIPTAGVATSVFGYQAALPYLAAIVGGTGERLAANAYDWAAEARGSVYYERTWERCDRQICAISKTVNGLGNLGIAAVVGKSLWSNYFTFGDATTEIIALSLVPLTLNAFYKIKDGLAEVSSMGGVRNFLKYRSDSSLSTLDQC